MSYQQDDNLDDLWAGVDNTPAGSPGGGRPPIFWFALLGGIGLLLILCLGGAGLLYLNSRDAPAPTEPVLAVPPDAAATNTAATLTAAAPTATTPPTDDDAATPAPTVTLAAGGTEEPDGDDSDDDNGAAGAVTAARLASPPAIDGNLSDWPAVATVSSAYRVFAAPEWDGSSDLEATWQLGWDEQNLYIGVTVVDDRHVQTQTGNQIWRGDSVDMQLDTNLSGDAGNDGLSPDDYQITLSPGDFDTLPPSAFRFRGTAEGQMLDATGHAITVAATPQGEGYVLEVAVPWSDLGLTPAANFTLGLALNANDNDVPGTAVQEIMMSHVSTRTFRNPQTWGELTLLP